MNAEKNKYISRTEKRKQDFQEYVKLLKETVSILQGAKPNALVINAPSSAISGSLYIAQLRPYATASVMIGYSGTSGFGTIGQCGVSGKNGTIGYAGKAYWTPQLQQDINAYHSVDVKSNLDFLCKTAKETAINVLEDFFVPVRGGK